MTAEIIIFPAAGIPVLVLLATGPAGEEDVEIKDISEPPWCDFCDSLLVALCTTDFTDEMRRRVLHHHARLCGYAEADFERSGQEYEITIVADDG